MTVRIVFLALALLVASGSPSVGVAQDRVATGAGAPPAGDPASPTAEGNGRPKSGQTDETPSNPPNNSPALFSTYIFQEQFIKCAKRFGISRANAIERYKHNEAVSANAAKPNDFKTSMELDEENRVSEEEVDSAASGCGYIHKEYYQPNSPVLQTPVRYPQNPGFGAHPRGNSPEIRIHRDRHEEHFSRGPSQIIVRPRCRPSLRWTSAGDQRPTFEQASHWMTSVTPASSNCQTCQPLSSGEISQGALFGSGMGATS